MGLTGQTRIPHSQELRLNEHQVLIITKGMCRTTESVILDSWCPIPGEKDHANTRLVRALVGTTWISADIREILTVQRPVTPKRAGASINDDGVSTFKLACTGDTQGR